MGGPGLEAGTEPADAEERGHQQRHDDDHLPQGGELHFLLLFDVRQGLDCAEGTAAIAARRLGWDAARTADELGRYRALADGLRRFA